MTFQYHCRCGLSSDHFTTAKERDQMEGIHQQFCPTPPIPPNSVAGRAAAARATTFGVRRRRV